MSASRIDKILSQYYLGNLHGVEPDMTPDQRRSFVVSTLQSSDPTPTGKYAGWLMRLWANGTLRIEDMGESARETLVDFERVKKMGDNGLAKVDRSILRYKTMGDLSQALAPFAEIEQEGSRDRKRLDAIKADMETYSFSYPSGLKVIIPLTRFSAQHHGHQTKWCTSADHNNAFEDYARRRPIVIFELPDGQKFQGAMFDSTFVDEFSSSFDSNDLADAFEFKNIYDNDLSKDEMLACQPYKDDIFQTLTLVLSKNDRENIIGSGVGEEFFDDRNDFATSSSDEDENDEDASIEELDEAYSAEEKRIEAKIISGYGTDAGLRHLVETIEPDLLDLSDAIVGNGDANAIGERLREIACNSETHSPHGVQAMLRAHFSYARGDMSQEMARTIIENAPPRLVEKFVCGLSINSFLTDKKPYSKVEPALFEMMCDIQSRNANKRPWPNYFTLDVMSATVMSDEPEGGVKSVHAAMTRLDAMSDIMRIAKKHGIRRRSAVSTRIIAYEQLNLLKSILLRDLNTADAKRVANALCDFVENGATSGQEVRPQSENDSVTLFGRTVSKSLVKEAIGAGVIEKPQAMRNLIKADPKMDIVNYDAQPEMRNIYRQCASLYAPKDINKLSRKALLGIAYAGLFDGIYRSYARTRRSMSAMPTPLVTVIPKAHMRLAYMSSCIPVYNAGDAAAFLEASKRKKGGKEIVERLSEKALTLVAERVIMAIHDSGLTDEGVKISDNSIRQGMNMFNPLFEIDASKRASRKMDKMDM